MKSKKNKIVIATNNSGKLKDFENLLVNYDFISLKDLDNEDIEEYGNTFEENALIKAKYIAEKYNMITISDDSGLECIGLDNRPGVHSKRYAGTNIDGDNNIKLLKEIKDKPREARFVSVICLYFPNGEHYLFRGEVDGIIIDKPKGTNGFGYDPLFFVPQYNKTFAEITIEQKNKISHRKKAIEKLVNSGLL